MLSAEGAVDHLAPRPREDRRVGIFIGSAVIVLIAAILANLGYSLLKQRAAALANAEATTQSLARVIEEQARGSADATDVTLASIARALPLLAAAREPGNREIHGMLSAQLQHLPFVRAIWVLDADGRMIHDSDDLPGSYDLSHRQYFRVHRDNPAIGLYLDPPILSDLGVWFVGASRRIDGPGGG